MAEQTWLYKMFWEKMDALTSTRPMTAAEKANYRESQALARFRRFKDDISTLNDFLKDVKKVAGLAGKAGVDVSVAVELVGKIAAPINVLNQLNQATDEAVQAAENVSLALAAWYRQAEIDARKAAGGDEDQYTILSAAIARKWQARPVKAVLGSQPDSFVMQLWPKWRDRIFNFVF